MNPVFWILVVLAAVALWFLLRRIFIRLGTGAANLVDDTVKILQSDEEEKK